jgi:hypothetical protein
LDRLMAHPINPTPGLGGSVWLSIGRATTQGSGVSCTGVLCNAVGHYVNSAGTTLVLAEHMSSTSVIQETPSPTGAKSSSFTGISCTATETCTAIGSYVTSGGVEETLAETITNTTKKWAIEESPNPTGAKSTALTGVSCTAVEACTAAGHYLNGAGLEQTHIQAITSETKKIAIQESPNPQLPAGSLPGVSCATTETCMAVGHLVGTSGVEVPLGEQWNGKEWSLQETASPTGAKGAWLSGVSCTAAEACTTVGRYVNSSGVEVALAEVFTSAAKKWVVQETPNPEEAKSAIPVERLVQERHRLHGYRTRSQWFKYGSGVGGEHAQTRPDVERQGDRAGTRRAALRGPGVDRRAFSWCARHAYGVRED